VVADMNEVLNKCRERTKKILEASFGARSKEVSFGDELKELEDE
jgi:hypothetical protein